MRTKKAKKFWGDPDVEWIPQRKGKIYCSPACGAGCKYSDYLSANLKARALAKRMGKGWGFVIWENMHWCWKVVKGNAEISMTGQTSCVVSMTLYGKQFIEKGHNPVEMFKRVKLYAQTAITRMQEELDAL